MMSMIVGEGTNLDGRGVTMTGLERGRIDAEMTGMTGSGIEEENGEVVESIGIMKEVGGRDSPRPDMT